MFLLVLPAFADPELDSQGILSPSLEPEGAATDDASLVLLYSSEQRGEIGPCGCDTSPKGGLGRLATTVRARQLARPDTPVLLVNPGAWLSSEVGVGELAPMAIQDNRWFQQALALLPFDALNVTAREIPSITARDGLVSATYVLPEGAVPVAPYVVVERGGLSVAITGVSQDTLTYLQPEGTTVKQPVQAVQDLLPELEPYDIVVVMVYDLASQAEALAGLPGVDVVIEAGGFAERWPAQVVGDAVWVRSRDAGLSMGELSLWVEDGRVVRAVDRVLRLSNDVPSWPRIDRLERKQDKAALEIVRGD